MIIIIQCRDQIGLVADISQILSEAKLNIVSMREHVDKVERMFFMRLEVDGYSDEILLAGRMREILPTGAIIHVNPVSEKRIVVMVTKEYHCLADILVRNNFGTLGATVVGVIGNHNTLQKICERFDVPFSLVSYDIEASGRSEIGGRGKTGGVSEAGSEGKAAADIGKTGAYENDEINDPEEEIIDQINAYNPDYVILAKFMRILSPRFVASFADRIINIHHSFLPAFAGANPYRQAFERGVKLIGATAHFVTNDLDEGPIIAQQIIPVNHSFTVVDMVRSGKEIETAVLAKAMRLVLSDRVFVYKNKTVIFEN